MRPTLSFLTLPVAELERSRRFYAALGWAPHPRSPPGCLFVQLNGLVLALVDPAVWAATTGAPPPAPGAVLLSHNTDTDADLDVAYAAALAAGARAAQPPAPTPWGGRRAFFCDPDGHRWELAHTPSARRDAHGGLWLSPPPEPPCADR